MENTFAKRNPKTGLIEIIDMVTGHVRAVQREPFSLLTGHQEVMVEHMLPSGEKVLLQKGVDPGLLANVRGEPFNQILVDLVCQAVAEGESLTKVCQKPGYPSYTALCRWRRQHPHINDQLDNARRDRAEYLRDKALEEAAGAESRDPIGAHNLRVDTYKWAAGVDDAKYSPKAKVEASVTMPTQIIVSTGINRTREVSDVNSKEQMATAMPTSSERPAIANAGDRQTNPVEVHTVPSAVAQPGDDLAGR